MNTLLEKLTVHVKRECSICHEMGEPCGAAKFCRDPLDIIFPFQVPVNPLAVAVTCIPIAETWKLVIY
jgi:hypothetical protein